MGRRMRKQIICIILCAKTKAQISFEVTANMISAFVFALRIVQVLYFLYPKFSVSNHLVQLACVGPVRKPRYWFSRDAAHISIRLTERLMFAKADENDVLVSISMYLSNN